MSDFAVFAPTYAFVDAKLDTFLSGSLGQVLDAVAPPLRAALVLYVLLYGVAILRGAIVEPVLDFAVRSLKLVIITDLATTTAYADWVTQPLFHTLPQTLAAAIGGHDGIDVGQAFDAFFSRAALLGETLQYQAALNIGFAAEAVAIDVIGALAAALGFGVLITAKVALAMIVALGPIFIGCALFEGTRRFFFGWLSQAVNYLVLFALILTIFQMVLAIVEAQWNAITGLDPAAGGLIFIALSFLGAILFVQTPSIAAGIAGGASFGASTLSAPAGIRGLGGGRGPAAASPRVTGGAISPAKTVP